MPMHPIHRRYYAEELVRQRRAGERRRQVSSQRCGRVDPNPHQIDAVMFALRRIPEGGCILADEVGLGKTIERCRTLLARSRDWVRFEVEPFRNALSCSLELMGGEPLRRALTESGQTVWALPDLDGQARGDPAWAGTLD